MAVENNIILSEKIISRIGGIICAFFLIYAISAGIEVTEYKELNKPIIVENIKLVLPPIKTQQIEKAKIILAQEEYNPQSNDIKNNAKPINPNQSINVVIPQAQIKTKNQKGQAANVPALPQGIASQEKAKLPQLSNSSEKTIHSIECLEIDKDKRPKDCPPNNNAKKQIELAKMPKYNPDKVQGFSNAEFNAKKYAGWRDKCEMDNGGKYMVCVPIGVKPPRVKTPYELCMEKGLGGCTLPKRADGTKTEPLLGFE